MRAIKLLFVLLCLAGLGLLHAQLSNATIKGTVSDVQGGVLPKATVELTNTGTGEQRTLAVTPIGGFVLNALPPGEYALKVHAEGYADWTGQLTLRVGQEAVVDPVMQPAQVKTVIEIRDVTPVINLESSSLADVKEAARIDTMPLQTRDFRSILNFTTGVVANNFAGQGQGYTRVNGIPGGSVDFLVDGSTAVEKYTNELQRLPQALPTIQEIRINTSNTQAEYSRPGVVEVATKSGTNSLHGQVFELNQNNHTAASAFHQLSVPFLVRNEYGFNLGGPVVLPKVFNGRNRTFFFVDYEKIHQRSNGASNYYTVPEKPWKDGDFSTFTDGSRPIVIYDPMSTAYNPSNGTYTRTPFAGNKIPESLINPIGKKVASYVPEPNMTRKWYEGPNWQDPYAKTLQDRDMFTAKLDQLIGNNRLSVRYTYTDMSNLRPKLLLNPNIDAQGGHNGALSYTQTISPTMINEVRGGVQRFHAYRGPVPITPPITETLGLPTYPGTIAWPSFYFVDGGSSWLPNYFDGIDRENPQDAPGMTPSAADNLMWTRGKHDMKFGFAWSKSIVNTFEKGQPGGDYAFSGGFTELMDPATAGNGARAAAALPNTGAGLADMLLGYVDTTGLNTYPVFYTRQSDYSGYVQDNWKATRKLTFNLGLRYEYWTPFADKRNQASTFNPNAPGGAVVLAAEGPQVFQKDIMDAFKRAGLPMQTSSQAGMPSSLWTMPKTNFAPRIGAAYQINSRTVLRGAYGMYHWTIPLVMYHQQTRRNLPFYYGIRNPMDPNYADYQASPPELTYPVGPSYFDHQAAGVRKLGQDFLSGGIAQISKANGWALVPWDPDFQTQRAQEWNVTLERELPGHFGGRLSYVGTHADHQLINDPINALLPRELMPGASDSQRRAYPDFATSGASAMDMLRTIGYANSNQFQAELKRNYASGVVVQAAYTFQKTLTTADGGGAGAMSGLEMLPGALTNNASIDQRLRLIYANDSGLPRHNASFNATYQLPFGQGKRFLANAGGLVNRLVSGWSTSLFYYWRSGLFFAPYYSARGSNTMLAPGKNAILPAGERQDVRWFDASVCRADMGDTCKGEAWIKRTALQGDYLNNVPRNYMTGPGFYNIDSSFYKDTPITERVKLRVEAQIFNLLNHNNLALPANTGVISSAVGVPRTAQFQGRLEF